ncbi:DNA polymerase III subunit beta [Paenibacillus sp. IITD108]|uniref:DNA polymerase III subunit beta n=1 Tax=Paenibacillus sp. IITD108 TaxID=3116649 RepID=UPI002F42C1F7
MTTATANKLEVSTEIISLQDRGRFIEMLSEAVAAIDRNPPVPILTGVLIEVEGSQMTLTGSDSSSSIRVIDEAVSTYMGSLSFVVPGNLFLEAMKKLPQGEIEFEIVPDVSLTIRLTVGKRKPVTFQLNLMKEEDYPRYVHQTLDNQLTMQSNDLATLLKTSHYAAEKKDDGILSGIQFLIGEGKLTVFATNRHRLAMNQLHLDTPVGLSNIVIPGNAAKEIIKVASSIDGDISIEYSENLFQLVTEKLIYQTRLLDGNYPDCSKIITPNYSTLLKLKRELLFTALDRASVCEGKVTIFDLNNNKLVIKVKSDTQYEEEVEVDLLEGKELLIGVDVTLFIDLLKHIHSEEIEIRCNGPLSPICISPTSDNVMKHVALVLPIRLNRE